MLKIILLTIIVLFSGCSQKPLEVQTGTYPKITKSKWQGNYSATLEDIFRELDERRAVEGSFK